jgi:hypothetical protein
MYKVVLSLSKAVVLAVDVMRIFNLVNSGLYYKPLMFVNDDSRIINKLEASLTDNARVIIYDRHMFTVQATSWF